MSDPEITAAVAAATSGASSGSFEMAPSQHSPAQHNRLLPQSPPLNTGQQQQQQQRSVKRPRPVKSCTECRKRKLRCDRLCPCSQCQKSNRSCKYAADYDSANLSDGSDGEIDAERPAKRLQGAHSGSTVPSNSEAAQASMGRSTERPASHGTGFIEELAVRMDRLEKHVMSGRPSDPRIGGSSMVPNLASTVRGLSVKRGGKRTRLFGQLHTRVLVNLFDDAKRFLSTGHQAYDIDNTMLLFRKLHQSIRRDYQDSLVPMTVFVDSVVPIWKRMTDILPPKPVCDRLVAAYIDISESITRIVHFPTFREQYNLFWDGKLQSDYFLPQLLAILAIVSRFTTKSQGFGHERVEGVHTPTAFTLVRTWLDGLRGKHLTDIVVIQIELLLTVCRRALMFRPQELWIQLGIIVRMAMTMGLHRDPSEFGHRISPFVGEMRRRLWFAVTELDIQSSFDSDMPCAVRDGDYTCQPPRNLDDDEIYPDMKELPPGKPVEEHTQMQAAVLASFSLPTRCRISHLLARLDTLQDYQEVLELGSRLEDFLDDTDHVLPRHNITDHSRMSRIWRERVSSDAHIRRALLALYRPFALSAPTCPPQITKAFLRSCMITLGYSQEPDPRAPQYNEIMGILHQVFRNDLLPAAFSVCYFIQASTRRQLNGKSYDHQSSRRHSSGSPAMSPPLLTEGRFMWSTERLSRAVKNTLDNFIQNIVRNVGTKEIVALALVLEMVQTPEPKIEEVAHALRSTLDGCFTAANSSPEKLTVAKPSQAQASTTAGFGSDAYLGSQPGTFAYGELSHGQQNASSTLEGSWSMWGGWD